MKYMPVLLVLLFCVTSVRAIDPPGQAVKLDDVVLDEDALRVHFIDIGPGLAMLIETPRGQHYFVDGGKWGLADLRAYVKHFVPQDTPIDIAIVTHADLDHYKGMIKLFEDYEVGQFWYTGYRSDILDTLVNWSTLLEAVESEEDCVSFVPLNDYVSAGETEILDDLGTANTADDVIVRYLNVDDDPPHTGPVFGRSFNEGQRRNNASLVCKIIYKNVSFLITGDINGRNKDHTDAASDNEMDSEELELWARHQLDSKYSLKATVLQAPHHGSNGSCSLPFIEAVDPNWIVIPAGHHYNHPDPATLRRMNSTGIDSSHILRTDEGDSTPEDDSTKDPRGDDSYIFVTNGQAITQILRVKVE